MQLEKMVAFHKAIGDPTRIRIIALLRNKPLHGQAIAEKLALKPPTITHHVKRLKDSGVVYSRRDKNTIYFHLDTKRLEFMSTSILRIGDDQIVKAYEMKMSDKEKLKILHSFITQDGRLKQLPSKLKKKIVILSYFAQGFEPGKVYEETEVNEYIQTFYDDFATIRREWIMQQFMYRENNRYERNPTEMWPIIVESKKR
ncbi:metalloregulator ArsR/SmtB family transcription factor [Halobacillus locisalis]|uniref:Metalloregulator ArsR/SmtB family transcription factor n=1 Tax=Halobacillus locisalis TaxID=220753 RepID=A0A838CQM3_9BACI|nr:metalloregulator ArsR/SmtB family transcription factor [Halobacillus locisalis]MBA2174412.1 metalloregulator ArsR/SmtB family transcription factor [Halobacillus locisalis]